MHGEAVPPKHCATLRGAGEQQEAVPDDGVWQRRRPVLQDHHQGKAEQSGDQAHVCSDRLCRQAHGEFSGVRRISQWPPGPRLLRPTGKKEMKLILSEFKMEKIKPDMVWTMLLS